MQGKPKSKPPLGVLPEKLWAEKVKSDRIADLLSAILRYSRASLPAPEAWVCELICRLGEEAEPTAKPEVSG